MLALVLIGLAFGSFLNVLIWRLNDDKAPRFWRGRSLCPQCGHELSWQDNIPLLSFILLGGRCRYCQKKISLQYPAVEMITAISFVVVGPNPLLLALAGVFIVIFFSDLIYGLIPDEAVAAGMGIGLIWQIGQIWDNLLVGIIAGLFFLAVVVATKFRGLGLGDVKLAFLIGFLLGWPQALVAFWSAFVLGGLVAVGLLVLKRTKLSATIALGPFLVAGVVISALWSDKLLALLLSS